MNERYLAARAAGVGRYTATKIRMEMFADATPVTDIGTEAVVSRHFSSAARLWRATLACLLWIALSWVAGCEAGSTEEPQLLPSPTTPLEEETHFTPLPSAIDTDRTQRDLLIYPPGIFAYQDYLTAIDGRPRRRPSQAEIEGTILSLSKGQVCPYSQKPCPIEPYPKDVGVVQVHTVVSVSAGNTYQTDRVREQPAEEHTPQSVAGDMQNSAPNPGALSDRTPKPLTNLQEGQSVDAIFLLTARPAIARTAPAIEPDANSIGLLSTSPTVDAVGGRLQPGNRAFAPLKTENGRYIFVTDVSPDGAATDTLLPGLQPGDHFRAEVSFDGRLYVRTYEVIPQ